MFWYPKTLKCQIYENNELIDLNKCSDPDLENIADEIVKHWRTPDGSALWFDVEIYEKHYWFKPTKTSIEVCAFLRDPNTMTGRRQISISKLHIDKKIGRKFKISPKESIFRSWKNTEVAFVV